MRRVARTLVVVAVGALASEARADEDEVEPIRLTYAAPSVCPGERTFIDQLQRRTQRARIVTGDEQERRSFEVEIVEGSEGFAGKLSIHRADKKVTRSLVGASCDEVVAAIALVAALAIDPHASTKSVAELPPPVDPPPPPPPVDPPPPPPPPSPRVNEPFSAPFTPDRTPRAPSPPWRFEVGITGGARSGTLPVVTPDGAAFVALRKDKGIVAPELRLGFGGALAQSATVPSGSASFGFFSGRAEACPIRLGDVELAVRPCATFEVGWITASASGVGDPQSSSRSWFAAGGSVRGEWEVVRNLFLEASADLVVPLRDDRFYFGPDVTVYQIPSIGGGGSLGVAFVPFP